MENAVVYARYSSHSQTEQSIEGQIAAAKKYADDKGYNIIATYVDRAKSGTTDNRESFQKMLRDCKKHRFTVIIVWKVDRFGRNREEITFNKYKAKKEGVRVEYIAENIAPGPEGVILESVLEGMAEYYSLQLSQNVSRGYAESAKKRHVIGNPPYGYEKGPDKKYKIVPQEAKGVKKIFDLYLEGNCESEIIAKLYHLRIVNKKGLSFTMNNINRILHDDRYIGNYRFKGELLEEDCIPAIIDKEDFYKVNKVSKEHLKMNHNNWSYSEYKLSNKLICGKCGNPMKGSSGNSKTKKKYLYYVCPKCKKIHIRADKLDEKTLSFIYDKLWNKEILDEITEKVYTYYESTDETKSELERLDALLLENNKRTSNIMKSIEDGLDYKLCKNRLDDLTLEKEELEALKGKLILSKPVKITKDMIYYFLTKMRDDGKDSAIVSSLIEKIVVFDDHCQIAINCVDTSLSDECSTIFYQMGQIDCQSNFYLYEGYVIFKMLF